MKVSSMVGGVFVVLVGLLAMPYLLSLTADLSGIPASTLLRAFPILILAAAIIVILKFIRK